MAKSDDDKGFRVKSCTIKVDSKFEEIEDAIIEAFGMPKRLQGLVKRPPTVTAEDTVCKMLEARTCPDCDGRGEVELLTSWAECGECDGTGRV